MSAENSRESRILAALAARGLQRKGDGFPATDEEIEAFKRSVTVPEEDKKEATRVVAQAVSRAVGAADPALPSAVDQGKPGAPARPPDGVRIKKIGGFELITKIGQGGMGSVFKARQTSLDRIVALKVLPPSIAKDQSFIQRFVREARASAKLAHPNIVTGIDVGQDEATGLWYFAMEFVDGPTLKQVQEKEKILPERRALEIARAMARALTCAQANGFIHRDIKPDNILLNSRGEAKLADLGLARQAKDDAGLTQSGQALGTPFYMSPEQVRGQIDNLDIRADLYALGATLFHLVTGRPPFEGETGAVIMVKHLRETPPLAHRINPDVSESTGRLIQRLMQKKQEDRIQTPQELETQLDRLLSGRMVDLKPARTPRTTGPRAPVRTTGPRTPVSPEENTRNGVAKPPVALYVGIGAGVGLVILVLAVFVLGGNQPPPRKKASARKKAEPAGQVPPVKNQAQKETPPPAPPVDRKQQAESAWAEARAYAKANPTKYRETLRRYALVLSSIEEHGVEGPLVDEVSEAIEALEETYSQQVESAWKHADKVIEAAVRQNDYDTALQALSAIPESLVPELEEDIDERRTKLTEEVKGKIHPVLKAAAETIEQAQPQQGLDALKEIETIKYAPLKKAVVEMRRKLEAQLANAAELERKRAQLAATKKLNGYLAQFDEALFRDNRTKARAAADAASGDELLKGDYAAPAKAMAEVLGAFDQVGASLGRLVGQPFEIAGQKGKISKVEDGVLHVDISLPGGKGSATQKVKFADIPPEKRSKLPQVELPATPAGRVAGAITKLRPDAPDLVAARKLLAEAKEFPLTPHYLEIIRIREVGEAEAAAEKAWPDLEAAAGKPCKTPEEGKALLATIGGYLQQHSKTDFVAAKKKLIEDWQAKAERTTIVNVATQGAQPFGGNLYKVFPTPVEFLAASKRCEEMGGHLVTITSEEEQEFITGLIRHHNKDFWLGLRVRKRWKNKKLRASWVTGERMDFKHASFTLDKGSRYCLKGASGKWDATSFHRPLGFICEWDNAAAGAKPEAVTAAQPGGAGTQTPTVPKAPGAEPVAKVPASKTAPVAAAAQFVGEDNKTQGNWKRLYGKNGYMIPGGPEQLPAYATLSTSSKAWWNRKHNTGSNTTRYLQLATSDERRAGWWYANNAPVNFDLKITDGREHNVSLYLLHIKALPVKVELLDANTGTALDAREVRNYTDGRYLTWRVKGHVQIRVSPVGENEKAFVSGVFFQ